MAYCSSVVDQSIRSSNQNVLGSTPDRSTRIPFFEYACVRIIHRSHKGSSQYHSVTHITKCWKCQKFGISLPRRRSFSSSRNLSSPEERLLSRASAREAAIIAGPSPIKVPQGMVNNLIDTFLFCAW